MRHPAAGFVMGLLAFGVGLIALACGASRPVAAVITPTATASTTSAGASSATGTATVIGSPAASGAPSSNAGGTAPASSGSAANESRPASGTPGAAAAPSGSNSAPTPSHGDKYANGILPVGDGRYVTGSARKGYILVCRADFVPAGQAGAQAKGPWFNSDNTWNSTTKAAIQGSVSWPNASFSMTVSGGRRVITTNALPTHPTGVYPVASSDPASRYDRNPNTIRAQSLRYDLTATPSGTGTNCIGGEVGVMLDGVPLFDGFDAGGRDAGAWEVQDSCAGHPQMSGEYHYHDLSPCLPSWDARTVVGFALDGYPITGPRIAPGDVLTTSDLDECHGMTGEIVLDGKTVTSYHYVMTQDFPYSVSCFRGTPIRAPGIPG